MMGNSINGAGAGSDSFSITLNEWNHFAICQHGDYQYHYKDGVSVNGVGVGKSSTVAFADLNVPLRIGYQQDVEYYNGWVDEIRISKGIARYPSGTTFTPFTTEYGALVTSATGNFISTTQTANATVSNMGIVVLYKNNAGTATLNTDLVANISADGGTNYETVTLSPAGTFSTGIKTAVANSVNMPNTGTAPKYKIEFANQLEGSQHTITAAGNGTISTFKKKFGVGSYYGDGTGDYLSIPESTDWDFGSGDFTMECWVHFNTVDPMGHGFSTIMWLGNYQLDYKVSSTELRIILQGMPGNYNLSATWVPTLSTWYHIAAVRNGADLKLFVDGTQIGSTLDVSTNATPAGGSGASFIGCRRPNLDRFFNGHMDEVRVSDTARYTANFTPATSAFTPDTNTKLLMHFEDPTLNVWPATPHQSTNFLDDDFACETQVHGVALLY